MRQMTGTEAGTLSSLLSYGTYVLDFRLKGTLCAGITRPECRRFKCMELTHLSRDQLQETAVYDARQAVQRPFHHIHLMEVPFLAYPNILKISTFNAISISWVEPKKKFRPQKFKSETTLQ